MIYISQLTLNPESRQVWREVENPYQLHRTLLKGFDSTRQDSGMLHRLEVDRRRVTVLVQSLVAPDWTPLLDAAQGRYLLLPPPPPKTFEPAFKPGRLFHFRLRANPTVKKARPGRQGNRVPLVHEQQQFDWLQRQADRGGFRLLHAQITRAERQKDWIPARDEEEGPKRRPLTLYTVQFDGLLQVTDPDRFGETLRRGIGPAKAFGCGLLSLAPA